MNKDQPTKPEKELSSFQQQFESSLPTDLVYESDRGCVLVGGAFVEDALGYLLRTQLTILATDRDAISKGAQSSIDFMLDKGFYARIQASRALGLIDNSQLAALDSLRELRNRFAHRKPTPPNLDMETVLPILQFFDQRTVTALRDCATRGLDAYVRFEDPKDEPDLSEARRLFIYAIEYMLQSLAQAREELRRRPTTDHP